MLLTEDYWNTRYINNEFGWDTGGITSPLKNYFDQLKDKSISILIPGAGNSYEAEYLFNTGFKNIFVLDFAEEPLKNLSQRCPGFPKQNLIKGNFFEHKGQYDVIVEQTFFCAIDKNLRSKYAKHVHELLKPKGRLVGLLFNTMNFPANVLNPDLRESTPPFGGSKEEYEKYFSPYFSFHTFEKCFNSIKPREGSELFINLVKK